MSKKITFRRGSRIKADCEIDDNEWLKRVDDDLAHPHTITTPVKAHLVNNPEKMEL